MVGSVLGGRGELSGSQLVFFTGSQVVVLLRLISSIARMVVSLFDRIRLQGRIIVEAD